MKIKISLFRKRDEEKSRETKRNQERQKEIKLKVEYKHINVLMKPKLFICMF